MGSSVNWTQTGSEYMDSTVGQWKLCKIQFREKHQKRSSKNYRILLKNVVYIHSQRVGHDWANKQSKHTLSSVVPISSKSTSPV